MPSFPFTDYTSADARRFAASLGTVDDPQARSCVVLLGSVPDGGELLLRADDDVIDGLPGVLRYWTGPMFIVSNHNAGSLVTADRRDLWEEALSIARVGGADLLAWLVVDGERVVDLRGAGARWSVRLPNRPPRTRTNRHSHRSRPRDSWAS